MQIFRNRNIQISIQLIPQYIISPTYHKMNKNLNQSSPNLHKYHNLISTNTAKNKACQYPTRRLPLGQNTHSRLVVQPQVQLQQLTQLHTSMTITDMAVAKFIRFLERIAYAETRIEGMREALWVEIGLAYSQKSMDVDGQGVQGKWNWVYDRLAASLTQMHIQGQVCTRYGIYLEDIVKLCKHHGFIPQLDQKYKLASVQYEEELLKQDRNFQFQHIYTQILANYLFIPKTSPGQNSKYKLIDSSFLKHIIVPKYNNSTTSNLSKSKINNTKTKSYSCNNRSSYGFHSSSSDKLKNSSIVGNGIGRVKRSFLDQWGDLGSKELVDRKMMEGSVAVDQLMYKFMGLMSTIISQYFIVQNHRKQLTEYNQQLHTYFTLKYNKDLGVLGMRKSSYISKTNCDLELQISLEDIKQFMQDHQMYNRITFAKIGFYLFGDLGLAGGESSLGLESNVVGKCRVLSMNKEDKYKSLAMNVTIGKPKSLPRQQLNISYQNNYQKNKPNKVDSRISPSKSQYRLHVNTAPEQNKHSQAKYQVQKKIERKIQQQLIFGRQALGRIEEGISRIEEIRRSINKSSQGSPARYRTRPRPYLFQIQAKQHNTLKYNQIRPSEIRRTNFQRQQLFDDITNLQNRMVNKSKSRNKQTYKDSNNTIHSKQQKQSSNCCQCNCNNKNRSSDSKNKQKATKNSQHYYLQSRETQHPTKYYNNDGPAKQAQYKRILKNIDSKLGKIMSKRYGNKQNYMHRNGYEESRQFIEGANNNRSEYQMREYAPYLGCDDQLKKKQRIQSQATLKIQQIQHRALRKYEFIKANSRTHSLKPNPAENSQYILQLDPYYFYQHCHNQQQQQPYNSQSYIRNAEMSLGGAGYFQDEDLGYQPMGQRIETELYGYRQSTIDNTHFNLLYEQRLKQNITSLLRSRQSPYQYLNPIEGIQSQLQLNNKRHYFFSHVGKIRTQF